MKHFNRENSINNILKYDSFFNREFLEGLVDEDLKKLELEVVYGW